MFCCRCFFVFSPNEGTARLIHSQSTIEVALAWWTFNEAFSVHRKRFIQGAGMPGQKVLPSHLHVLPNCKFFRIFRANLCGSAFWFAVGIFTLHLRYVYVFVTFSFFLDAHCIKAIFFSMRSHSWNTLPFILRKSIFIYDQRHVFPTSPSGL